MDGRQDCTKGGEADAPNVLHSRERVAERNRKVMRNDGDCSEQQESQRCEEQQAPVETLAQTEFP